MNRDKKKDGTVVLGNGVQPTRLGTTTAWAFADATDQPATFTDGKPAHIGDLLVSVNGYSRGEVYRVTKVYPVTGNVDVAYTGVIIPPVAAPDLQIFTADGTWNKPPGARRFEVEVLAAGGAGGGAGSATTGQNSAGTGGGAGGFAKSTFASADLTDSVAVTVGAGGVGVYAGNGGNGGPSSFGAYVVCAGGIGGTYRASNGVNHAQEGGSGGGVSAGQLQIPGAGGGVSLSLGVYGKGGEGADSPYGSGGKGRGTGASASVNTGYSATGYGAGGGGALNTGVVSSGNRPGGDGSPGLVIVKSYFAD